MLQCYYVVASEPQAPPCLTQVDYVDDAYGEYYPMAAGFEAEAIDEDELEGRKGAAAAAAAAAPLDQGAADKSKAEALSAKQQASKLQSQLAKIQNIMQRKGQDHKEAFAMPPKVCGNWAVVLNLCVSTDQAR